MKDRTIARVPLALVATLLLTGCVQQPSRPDLVRGNIQNELKAGLAEKAEIETQALLPPLIVDLPPTTNEPRFDLSVVGAPAAQVFMAIVSGTHYNMLVHPDVSGQITVNLKDVTVREALEALRELYGYEYEIKGNRITLQPNSVQTRMFQVNYLASRRQGSTELRVTSSAISAGSAAGGQPGMPAMPSPAGQPIPAGSGQPTALGGNVTSRVSTSSEADFWRDLKAALDTLVGEGDGRSVVVNGHSGVVVVRALPRELRAVEQYLRATQTVVERQVMLEAKIVEVSLKEEFQTGINWASFNRNKSRLTAGIAQPNTLLRPPGVPSTGGPSTMADTPWYDELGTSSATVMPGVGGILATTAMGKGFFGLAFQTANFATLLNFLESQGTVSVLSSPRIATLNNQKAVLKVGTDELYVTNVTTTSTTSGTSTVNSPSLTLQPYFSGISLDVTPQIDGDDNIILHIHPAVSTVAEREKIIDLGALGQYKLPLASSTVNETDSIVRVKDGHIVAIGGLMAQSQSSERAGLPGASREPILGGLFGSRSASLQKRELVILIKPTLVRDASTWQDDLRATSARIDALQPTVPSWPQP